MDKKKQKHSEEPKEKSKKKKHDDSESKKQKKNDNSERRRSTSQKKQREDNSKKAKKNDISPSQRKKRDRSETPKKKRKLSNEKKKTDDTEVKIEESIQRKQTQDSPTKDQITAPKDKKSKKSKKDEKEEKLANKQEIIVKEESLQQKSKRESPSRKDKAKEKDKEKEKVKDKDNKEKDKEKKKEKDKNKEKDGGNVKDSDKDRQKEKEKGNDTKEKERDKSKKEKKHKDNGKEKEREKEIEKEKQKEKEREKEREKEKEAEKERERVKEIEKEKDKERERERLEKEREREKEKQDKDKNKHKEKEKKEVKIEIDPKLLEFDINGRKRSVSPRKPLPSLKQREIDAAEALLRGGNKNHNRGNRRPYRGRSRSKERDQGPPNRELTEAEKKDEEERKKRLRLARARLIKYDKSDDEEYQKVEFHEELPRHKLDHIILGGDQFTEEHKKRVMEKEQQKLIQKSRQQGQKILYDSDGLEADGDEDKPIVIQSSKPGEFVNDDDIESQTPAKQQKSSRLQMLKQLSQKMKQDKSGHGGNHHYKDNAKNNVQQIDEEDPLEAFMKTIKTEAVVQEPVQAQQDDAQKVITLEDVLKEGGQDTYQDENDQEEEKFHEQFMKQIKQKEVQDRLRMEEEIEEEELDAVDNMEQEENDFLTRQRKLMEKRELKAVDHSKIDYQPFRKNLYHEVSEITMMTDSQITAIRQSLGNVKVRGRDIPKPVTNWYQCGLVDRVLTTLTEKLKFDKPYPIQCQAIPCIMSGRDFIGIAETGSGKTLAYVLPMIRHILDQPALKEGDGPIALIMAPTRELAHQIWVDSKVFFTALGLNSVCCVGGAGIAGQLSGLKRGAEMVVCTPGRMIDVLTTSNGKVTNLRRVTYVVIDEADRMFDLGFEPQIYRIINNIRPDKQMVMFSATFPKNVEMLAKKTLDKPIECIVGDRGQAGSNIQQIVEQVEDHERLYQLLLILQEWQERGSILIFVEKQSEADALFKELVRYRYRALLLHGGLDPTDREFTIHDFKKGIKPIMVATSICSRGLDIKSIVLVINFQCPNHMEDYIHRIGRTGRAGQSGTAITFFTPNDEMFAGDLITALEKSNQVVPQWLRDCWKAFNEKVQRGEAKMYHNRNRAGQGFKFNEVEKEKVKATRLAIRKQMGLECKIEEDSTDDDEFFSKISRVKQLSDDERKKLQEEKERAERERVMELIKDPNLKQQILSEATKAANACITSGGSKEQVHQTAIDAIKRVLKNFMQTNRSVEGGIEEAMQIINEFEERERIANEFVSYDFEINDYPSHARSKVCSRDFLDMIRELTNCTILIRGSYVEANKKVPLGQRKQFLRIEGESEFFVLSAYKEIKRVAEDMALRQLQQQLSGKFPT